MASKQTEKQNSNVRLSKSLSWLLRHNAENEGFSFLDGGYLPVEAVLQHRRFKGFSVTDVEDVVKNCSKQRFTLSKAEDGSLLIRANQVEVFVFKLSISSSDWSEGLIIFSLKHSEMFSIFYFNKWIYTECLEWLPAFKTLACSDGHSKQYFLLQYEPFLLFIGFNKYAPAPPFLGSLY